MSGQRFGLTAITCVALVLIVFPMSVSAQAPYPMPGRPAPQPMPPPQPQMPQQPLEYAFRPELTNPEYGECLTLEKNWRDLWNRYYQLFQHTRTANPADPHYQTFIYQAQQLKMQLDIAWQAFSSKCIYFPRR
jgi:hypothetical protein